jgi:uncharacterized YccA/Bax inhibitor family protein
VSTATKTHESPQIPWGYLGGYLVFFIGLGISFLGGFMFAGGPHGSVPRDKQTCLAIIGVGLVVFAFGSFLIARSEQIRGCHMGGLIVCFLMTPLPSLAGLLINFLGNYLRKTASTPLQVVLIAVGIFLLTLAGNWGWALSHGGIPRIDFRAFVWVIFADLGVACLVLAALPMVLPEETAASPAIKADQPTE